MVKAILVLVALTFSANEAAAQFCGIPPFAPIGCKMVCIDGTWHTICGR